MREFSCGVRICAGDGALGVLNREQAKRVFVVTDSYFSGNGTAAAVGSRVPGAVVEIFDKVTPDPTAALAAEGAALCRRFQPELLIALGGGSPMDCAKAIRLAYGKPLRFAAIPTTAGSGSEVTTFSILTHEGIKHPLVDRGLLPDLAILDPTLVATLPPGLVAEGGMDLLAHCVEALGGTNHSAFSDGLALQGAALAVTLLPDAFRGDTSVRGTLQEAATMAGLAFDHAGLGVCHALAHALGGVFHIPHGRLCGMLLPGVIEFNAPAAERAYGTLAQVLGCRAAAASLTTRNLISTIRTLRTRLRLPATLTEAGVTTAQWKAAEETVLTAALEDPCCRTNPVPVTRDGLRQILRTVIP